MATNIDQILKKIEEKMEQQSEKQVEMITKNLTENFAQMIDEKLNLLAIENQNLKKEIDGLTVKVNILERETRKSNLIIHGLPEQEKNNNELMESIITTLNILSNNAELDPWDKWEISKCHRIGKKSNEKKRPVLISPTLAWRRTQILKNNRKFPDGVHATEDMPREVLNKRRELRPELLERLKEGKVAFIKYDRLIVKEKEDTNEKRKRSPSDSPSTSQVGVGGRKGSHPHKINKTNKINNFFLNSPKTGSTFRTTETAK
jgi:hypothetical protein